MMAQATAYWAHRDRPNRRRSRLSSPSHGVPCTLMFGTLMFGIIILMFCLQFMHPSLLLHPNYPHTSPPPVQTAPASLDLLACYQEVAPPHFAIYCKSIFMSFIAKYLPIWFNLPSRFIHFIEMTSTSLQLAFPTTQARLASLPQPRTLFIWSCLCSCLPALFISLLCLLFGCHTFRVCHLHTVVIRSRRNIPRWVAHSGLKSKSGVV